MKSNTKAHDPFADFDDQDDDFGTAYKPKYSDDDFDLDLEDPYPKKSKSRDAFADEDAFDAPQALSSRHTPSQSAPQERNAKISAKPVETFSDDELGAISIPRIAIHFFVETDVTEKACESAANDRRMSRAQCLVRTGGIMQAIRTYQTEPTPSLLVVESTYGGRDLLEALGQLAEVCDVNTKVVIIGAHNDIRLFRELMRQGVSDYVVAPLSALQVIKFIANLFNDPETPFVGRTIAFISARGGAGASSVAHNFAYLLSESMQANTIIVDYDMPFGTAGLDFNQDTLHGMADALNAPERLDSVLLDRMLIKCTERLSLFSSPATLDQDFTNDPEVYEEVTRKVRSIAPFIVMDLPHAWSPWVKENLIKADDVIIVATPDLASLRNAKNIIDLLKAARPNDAAPKIVLNQSEMPGRPEIPLKDFVAALGVEPIAIIPFDAKTFGQASNNGQMIPELSGDSKVKSALVQMTAAITGRAPEVKAKKSILSNLFKK